MSAQTQAFDDAASFRNTALFIAGRYAYGMDPEDVVHDFIVDHWSSIAKAEGRIEVDCHQVKSYAKSKARRDKRYRSKHIQAHPIEETQQADTLAPDIGLDYEKIEVVVSAVLASLSERYRTAVWLRDFAGCSHEECAAKLNVSKDTWYTVLKRARDRFRAVCICELKEHGLDELLGARYLTC